MQQNASTPQSHINTLMVEYARQNKTIARLKGGDVSIFSNILDELQALKKIIFLTKSFRELQPL